MLRFTDDIAVIDETEEELQKMLRRMEETLFNVLNMKINTKKTKEPRSRESRRGCIFGKHYK